MQPHPSSNNMAQSTTIWDLPLRLFHWAMVAVVFVAAITGYFFEEWWLDIHVFAGYALTSLLVFRLIWGLVGSYYSRFSTFPLSKSGVQSHLKGLIRGKSPTYPGHNPVGAWMIVILLVSLSGLVLTGLIVWGGQENNGPLATVVGYQAGEWSEEIHEALAGILMAAIAVHLLGVIAETVLFKHPVINAMITGKKDGLAPAEHRVSHIHSILGLVIFICVSTAFTYWVNAAPSPAQLAGPANTIYQQECGDCHPAYHPSLRTAQDWQSIMDGLSNHYGEDASLFPDTHAQISAFLVQHNATSFDTEVAHKIGRHTTASFRMTDTRYWQKKHDELSTRDFSHPSIGSKVNCNACHQDADSGRFDDAKIKLPKGVHS